MLWSNRVKRSQQDVEALRLDAFLDCFQSPIFPGNIAGIEYFNTIAKPFSQNNPRPLLVRVSFDTFLRVILGTFETEMAARYS